MTLLGIRMNRHYEAGIKYLERGEYELAIQSFRKAEQESEPNSGQAKLAHFHLGEAHAELAEQHMQSQSWTSAEDDLKRALEINPNYADLHFQLAQVYFATSRFDDARVSLGMALAINPRFARAIFMNGLIDYMKGSRDSGLETLERARELDNTFNVPEFERAVTLDSEGEFAQAAEVFRKVGEMSVDEIGEHIRDAKECLRIADFNNAQYHLREALRVNPGYADLHNLMGVTWHGKGEYLRAVNSFKEALLINPRFVAAHANLGKACDAMGNRDAARKAYEHVLQLEPHNQEAIDYLSRS